VKDAGHIQALFDRPALEHALAFADRYLKGKDAVVAGAGSASSQAKQTSETADSPRAGGASDGQ
jgi:hypothetical protein